MNKQAMPVYVQTSFLVCALADKRFLKALLNYSVCKTNETFRNQTIVGI
jgi:hypothetical protein